MRPENSEKKEFVLSGKNTAQRIRNGGSILFESGGEFILPDYMPKVQKVLRMEARALPPAQYINGTEAQMSGSVLHTLIYLGEDGEVSATVLPSKYDFSVPLVEGQDPQLSADAVVDSVTYRLSAPRKINIRTRLRSQPCIYTREDISEEQLPAAEMPGLHKLYGEFDGVDTLLLRAQDVELSDSIELGGKAEIKPLWCGATAAVTDARAADGGVGVRGDVYAKVLILEACAPKMLQKKIPFDEFLEADIQKGTTAAASARVISTEAGVSSDNSNLMLEVILAIEGRADQPRKIRAVTDAFSETAEGKIEYRPLETDRLLFSRCGVYDIGGSVAKNAAGASDAVTVLDTSGEAKVEEATARDGKISVSGRCAMNSIYTTESGETSGEFTVPFKISFDCETPDGTEVMAEATLVNARSRLDGDNLVCDAEIALCMRVLQRKEAQIVGKIDFSAPKRYEKNVHPVCLIYPKGESLWTISKQYHVAPEALAAVNGLSIPEEDYTDVHALDSAHVLMLELK